MSQNKPLVTIAMMTYNQEKYVRDSVRGLLSQTYEPLEIVISDDCSTDRTWDIICEEVDSYKSHGGIHSNIVLNRNEKNLGIAKHSDLVGTFKHGEITVACGGDDISFPNRVERIVEVFEGVPSATWVMSQAEVIDEQGVSMGITVGYGKWWPLGAASAWRNGIVNRFSRKMPVGAYEDWIMAMRALMFGEYVNIDEVLLKYRHGGVSTRKGTYEDIHHRGARAMIQSFVCILADLEDMKSQLRTDVYHEIYDRITKLKIQQEGIRDLLEKDSIVSRWNALRKVRFPKLLSTGNLGYLLCVLPKSIGRPLLHAYWSIRNFVKC